MKQLILFVAGLLSSSTFVMGQPARCVFLRPLRGNAGQTQRYTEDRREDFPKTHLLWKTTVMLIWLLICAITIPSSASSVQRAALSPAANQAPREAKAKAAPEQYSPLLRGVDHFFAYSSEPETLFKFFRDTLGLPQVWDFKNFGDFASGGVWMGNVEFEVVTWKPPPGDKPPTEFKGIAFEPVGYTDDLVKELDRRAIKHGKPETTFVKDNEGRERVGWINTGIDGPGGIPPSNVFIFVYDSTSKEEEGARNERSNTALRESQGGPLGIVRVKELAIGVADLKAATVKWRMLLDRPDQQAGNLYRFNLGPDIRLFAGQTDGFKSIVLQVRSLQKAKEFLAGENLLKKSSDNTVAIDPSAIGGLSISLEQIKVAPGVLQD